MDYIANSWSRHFYFLSFFINQSLWLFEKVTFKILNKYLINTRVRSTKDFLSPNSSINMISTFWEGTYHLTWRGGYGFLFRSEFFFRTTQELEYFFFPEFNIRLYDKNSESNYFFFLHQNQNIFFSNIGNQNIFLEKNHTPLQVKWSIPYSLHDEHQSSHPRSVKLCCRLVNISIFI